MNTCTNCGVKKGETHPAQHSGWWGLANYFGISGTFCPKCYSKVSHDAYGKPKHPKQYAKIWKQQNGDKV